MVEATIARRHPGPAPVAPILPVVELQRLAARLEDLVDELGRCRMTHEAAFPTITEERFIGATADGFRWALAGQLRRSVTLQDALLADLDHVRWLLVQAMAMQERYELALADWRRRLASYNDAVLALGRGPLQLPDPPSWAWATRRSWS